MMKRKSDILLVLSLTLAIVLGMFVACSDDAGPGDYVGLEHELIGISVGGEYKTDYTEGETFDIDGMKVTANYADDKNETVEFGDYTYTPSGALTVADTKVTVKYSGFSYEIAVTVAPASENPDNPDKPVDPDDPIKPTDPEKPIEPELPDPPPESDNGSIAVTKKPDKTSYYVGETFDKTGMEVTHTKKDGSTEIVADFTIDKKIISAADIRNGKAVITVTYKDMTVEFSVEAHEPKLVSLIVDKAPDKTDYFVGDILDSSGLEVKASYENGGDPKTVEGYFLLIDDERDLATYRLNVSDKTVTVVYIENGETKTAVFEINVRAPIYSKLEITVDPAVTAYLEGEHFDPQGLVVSAVYENGSSRNVTDYSLSIGEYTDLSAYALQITDRQITVTYTENEITYTATIDIVVSETILTGLKVGASPDKTEYMAGDSFDPSGLVIYGVYNDDESLVRELSGWEIESAALAHGMAEVTVKYGDFTVNVPIAVFAKYKFEAESLEIEAKPDVIPDVRYGFEYAGKDHTTVDRSIVSGMGFVGNMQSINAFTLNVHAESDCDAIFGMSYARHSASVGSAEFVKTIVSKLTVGSEEFAIDGDAAIYGNADGIRYLDFCETDFARIRLRKGENTIKIYTTGASRNFDYVTVKATVQITLSAELTAGHDWSDYYVVKAPTSEKGGEMYRYCHTCMTREVVMLPPDLTDTTKYVKGDTVSATATKNGYTEYTYNGITFKMQQATEYYVDNRFDLEDATRNEAFNTSHGIKYNPPVTDISGKYAGAHGNSVENFSTRGGGEFTWTVYAPTAADGRLLVRILGDSNEYNPSFSLLLTVNGKPIALDDTVYSQKTAGWQYLDVAGISLEQGKNTITIQAIAGGFTYMDDIVVKCPVTLDSSESRLVKSIAVTQAPTKTVYAKGETFNPAGMVVTATRVDGATFTVERFKVDRIPFDTVGQIDVTVWAENYETRISVTVEDIQIVALQIISNPDKTEYLEGELLDTTGLEVRAIYNNDTQAQLAIDDLTFDITRFKGGETTVTVSIGDVSVSYGVVSKFISRLEAEGAEWNCNVRAFPEKGTESGAGRIGNWKEQTAVFDIYVEKDVAVDLYITFTGIEANGDITQFVADVTVDNVSYIDQLVATFADNSWNKIYTAKLASFSLSAGEHVLKLVGASGSTAKNSNFDYITFHTTAARAIWSDEKENGKHWSDWQVMTVPTSEKAGLLMRQSTHGDVEELELPADLDGDKYTVIANAEPTADEFGYTTYEYAGERFNVWKDAPASAVKSSFRAVDTEKIYQPASGAPIYSSSLKIDYYNTVSNRLILRFDLWSDKTATAKLYLELFGSAGAVKPYRAIGITVNGKPVIGDRAETKITDTALSEVFFGMTELKAGKNTIVLTSLGINTQVWLHKLGVISAADVSWQPNALVVSTAPEKTIYGEGETFERAGLTLESRYVGHNNAVVQTDAVTDFTIDDEQKPIENGQKYVTARFGDLSVQVPIVVRDSSIKSLSVVNGKVDYVLSETLDKTYLTVRAESATDGTITLAPEDYVLDFDWRAGDVTVTVAYVADQTVSTTFTVHVYADYTYSVFEAEKFEISGNATVGLQYENQNRKKEQANDPNECVGTYLVNIDKPTQLTFRPYNPEDRDVYVSLALRYSKNGGFNITDFIKSVTVNGEAVRLSYVSGESDGSSGGWQDFVTKTPFTAPFKLVPGENEITIALVGNGNGCNLDSIVVVGAVTVVSMSCRDGHTFTDWTVYSTPENYETSENLVYNMYRICDGCGTIERVFLPDYLDTEKGYELVSSTDATETSRGTATYTYDGKRFTVYTDAAIGAANDTEFSINDAVIEQVGEQNMPAQSGDRYNLSKGTMASFTYSVTSSADATVRLIIKTENKGYYMPGRTFQIKVNGKLIGLERNVFGWQGTADKYYVKDNYRYVTLAAFDLKQGDNTIELSHYGADFVCVYGVTLQSAATIGLQ